LSASPRNSAAESWPCSITERGARRGSTCGRFALGPSLRFQVYNAEIAKVGQWTFQLHSNYAFIGRKEPDFPGGLVPNHALQGTGEWAWGTTDWWEMGFYTPYAVDQELTPYSNAAKIRQLFVIPNAAEREFFYGVNFEFSYAMPQFSETRWFSGRCFLEMEVDC
jgi:hypothetical protein